MLFFHGVFWGWFGRAAEEDGRGRLLRRRVTLICAGCSNGLAQSRMTVLRRGVVPSTCASPMSRAHLSPSSLAHTSSRTFRHPSSLAARRMTALGRPCFGLVVEHGPNESDKFAGNGDGHHVVRFSVAFFEPVVALV
jgi:hypothetical protein